MFQQKELLNQAIAQLKREFVGIDQVIDRIGESITSWLYFPEMQERPVIINLWGLTGTGKTSVVKRLVELIGYGNHYFRFDLGESSGRTYDIQDSFKDIYENCNGEPFIIGLDEFQLARTINEEQEEIDKASSRAIWDLLDSGKFDVIDFSYNMGWLGRYIKKLDNALLKGVEVEKGIITANMDIYNTIMQIDEDEDDDDEDEDTPVSKEKKNWFVNDTSLSSLYYIVDHLYLSTNKLREELEKLDGDETVDFLIDLYKKSLKPKTVDCTKSLIFVMGNLDEVYSMNKNFNPDINADEFHRQSKEITITQVKESLLGRFRSEQIARLGNTHIIYPAFNRQNFLEIIRLELAKISKKVKDIYGLQLVCDEKIEQLIYEEGVYPTQGTRPLFTTIYQIINTRLGKILNEVYFEGHFSDTIRLSVNEEKTKKNCIPVEISFLKDGKEIHRLIDQQLLELGKLRQEKFNDEQAIVAVHESDHAILSSILMRIIPDMVLSVTADSESNGFVLARPEWNYVSKKEIINRLAVMLGGFVAEQIIFGEENVTIGSSSDLQKATGLATHVLYNCGMGYTRVTFGNQHMLSTPSVILDRGEETINQEAKAFIAQAEKLAIKTLEEQKVLLLHMVDYLSDKRCADKKTVKEFIRKYAVNFDISSLIEDEKQAQQLFYRNQLKKLVEEVK